MRLYSKQNRTTPLVELEGADSESDTTAPAQCDVRDRIADTQTRVAMPATVGLRT